MMPSLFGSQTASLTIEIENDLYILSEHGPDVDIRGQVKLYLPKSKQIKAIYVTLESKYSLSLPAHGWESGTQATKSTNIFGATAGERYLPEGEHVFDFSLVLPSNWAPYDRTKWGRVFNRLVAVVETPNWLEPSIRADRVIGLAFNHAPASEPNDIDVTVEGYEPQVGAYCLTFTSPHLAVGGMYFVSLYLPSPPFELNIYSVTFNIIQKAALYSRLYSGGPEYPDPQVLRLKRLNGRSSDQDCHDSFLVPFIPSKLRQTHSKSIEEPVLATVEPGEPFFMSFTGKLPDDDYLRPTTSEISASPIELSHQLQCLFKYDIALENDLMVNPKPIKPNDSSVINGRRLREIAIARKLVVDSCACQLDTILLPSYNPVDPLLLNEPLDDQFCRRRRTEDSYFPCLCEVSLEKQGYEQFHKSLNSRRPPLLFQPDVPPGYHSIQKYNNSNRC